MCVLECLTHMITSLLTMAAQESGAPLNKKEWGETFYTFSLCVEVQNNFKKYLSNQNRFFMYAIYTLSMFFLQPRG